MNFTLLWFHVFLTESFSYFTQNQLKFKIIIHPLQTLATLFQKEIKLEAQATEKHKIPAPENFRKY